MEKISALIDKLQELKNSNASLQAISYYAQLLQAEVLHVRAQQRVQEQQKEEVKSHVAVIMPVQPAQQPTEETIYSNGQSKQPDTPAVKTITVETVQPAPAEATPPERKAVAATPVAATLFDVEQVTPARNGKERENTGTPLRKELNELVTQTIPSLNDKLKQSKVELGDKLGEMPVKDLRQAIGINDKFLFVQELFRGDVDMYERSIKTINEFRTLQQAEYWIERELKIRQGWLDDTRTVQHFYSLVRKRFS
jgi:hypothetical protein